MSSLSQPYRRGGKWPALCAWLAVIALMTASSLMAVSGPAFRMEWIALGDAFSWLRMGAQLAAVAAILGILTIIVAGLCKRWGAVLTGAVAAVVAVTMIAMPVQMQQRAQTVPPIHDITTDMDNPPAFVALARAREEAPNAVDYPGIDTARQQQVAYPMLQPITLTVPMAQVQTATRDLIAARGWKLAEASPATLEETAITLEATATTRWFGFKDDVVVRLTDTSDGVRVDIRSASRLGKSDLGTNAERIQDFLEDLQHAVR
ncbi:DUF1499 domain-containing protein [Marinobacter sp. LV10MA510-1]|uniref:DUF1499 domain-containing protein n=1 Tax=Marinobacter sp. LV10MA510-1 TaxID=1415567 RepID=UPI000BF2636E|nr:DUF1499 domain-containing protein [Marinobacter sp. LV10MA510-1]PFG10825.1 uncharacterized protein DUF1499 [Marinobacter sp. LV10MA510-1]